MSDILTSPPPIDANKISVNSIRLLSANIKSSESAIQSDFAPYACTTEVRTRNMSNTPNKEFISYITINLEGIDKNQNQLGISGEFQLEIRVVVDNFEEYLLPSIEKDGMNVTVIHPILTGTMMSIIYSTARGIVFMRTLGTVLDGVILPVLDPLKIAGVII